MEMDSTGDQKASVGATILLKCVDTNPETGSTLEVSFETLKLKMSGVDFDSSKPSKSEDGMDDIIRPLIGTKLSMKMDKEGNITSFDGGMGGLGDQMGGADIFKNMFGSLSTSKKGTGQASVGEKWTNEDTMDAGMGTVRITTTNTLKSATGTTAVVEFGWQVLAGPILGQERHDPGLFAQRRVSVEHRTGNAGQPSGEEEAHCRAEAGQRAAHPYDDGSE